MVLAGMCGAHILGPEAPLIALNKVVLIDTCEVTVHRGALNLGNGRYAVQEGWFSSPRLVGTDKPMLVAIGIVDKLGLDLHKYLLDVICGLSRVPALQVCCYVFLSDLVGISSACLGYSLFHLLVFLDALIVMVQT